MKVSLKEKYFHYDSGTVNKGSDLVKWALQDDPSLREFSDWEILDEILDPEDWRLVKKGIR